MIVIDTNVISELWKIEPDSNVLTWIDAQALETLYLSAVTVAELRYGLAMMPEGKRRSTYQQRLEHEVLPLFSNRVLAFYLEASNTNDELMAQARAAGRSIAMADGYIAAIAATHDFMVATRDIRPFEALRITVINPWKVRAV